MALKKWTIKCSECGKQNEFNDSKDITYAHWQIISWNVRTGEPICVCDGCNFGKPKQK